MKTTLTKRQRELNQKAIKRIVELKQQAYKDGLLSDKYEKSWTNLYWSDELKRFVAIPE